MDKKIGISRKIAAGFALTMALLIVAAIFLRKEEAFWEFALYETLPYYANRGGERLLAALPWAEKTETLDFAEPENEINPEPETGQSDRVITDNRKRPFLRNCSEITLSFHKTDAAPGMRFAKQIE